MFGYIILRDIPKIEVQIDLAIFEIKGGFRGFAQVLPGNHFVKVKIDEKKSAGFWCNLKENDAVIKIYDYEEGTFNDCNSEEEKTYKEMALSGSMNQYLIPVFKRNKKLAEEWKNITNFMTIKTFPYKFRFETQMVPPANVNEEEMSDWFLNEFKNRFELAFYDSHNGNMNSFLEEFQFAFVKYMVEQKDQIALSRWFHLLLAIKSAGERAIAKEPELFAEFVRIIILQFNNFSDQFLISQKGLMEGFDNLIEDMIDTGLDNLIEKGKELEDYLQKRGVTFN